MSMRIIATWVTAAVYVATPAISASLTVTQPTAATVAAAGDDYATQVLGNPWDMKDTVDINTEESRNVTNQSFGGGVFSGLTTAADANIYPLFEGQLNSINLSRGANFPVDTSHYRYFTVKLKATQPGAPVEFSRLVFFQINGTSGLGVYHALPNNAYTIFTNDMYTQIDGTSPHTWTQLPQVTDPSDRAGNERAENIGSLDRHRIRRHLQHFRERQWRYKFCLGHQCQRHELCGRPDFFAAGHLYDHGRAQRQHRHGE